MGKTPEKPTCDWAVCQRCPPVFQLLRFSCDAGIWLGFGLSALRFSSQFAKQTDCCVLPRNPDRYGDRNILSASAFSIKKRYNGVDVGAVVLQ